MGVWLSVDWDKPASNGAYIQEYEIRPCWKKANGTTGPWSSKTMDGPGYSDTSILDVDYTTTYGVQVRDWNVYGWGRGQMWSK